MFAPGRLRVMTMLATAQLLGMSLWFTASAVAPAIAAEWSLDATSVSWLTLAVQIGFVAGTLLSATLNLPDVLSPQRLIAAAALSGALLNAALALTVDSFIPAVTLRFLTGAALAGVYPPAMKLIATWFREGRGLALGILVGALTVGKASPYLINAIGSESWRVNLLAASLLAAAGGLIVLLWVPEGPYSLGRAPFDLSQVTSVFRDRAVRLANFGYFGHMWELYAMWVWLPVMIRASFEPRGLSPALTESVSFVVIGAGAAGCVVAGIVADRVGRTVVTSVAMAISGACCLLIGALFQAPAWMLITIAAIWGASVVADSAQFSACVTELSDQRYVGTALTMQTSIGFLLTTVSIAVIPWFVERVGWEWAFVVLAPGPILGTVAMLRLRRLPAALKIAQGRR
jgi:MFS family permease